MGLFSDFYSCLYNYLRTTYAFLVYYSIERKPFKGERQIFICFGVVYIFYPNTLNSSALYFAKNWIKKAKEPINFLFHNLNK